jgi:hypothetical protein
MFARMMGRVAKATMRWRDLASFMIMHIEMNIISVNAFVISIAMSEIFHGIFKMVTVASLRLSDNWIPEITYCHLLGFFLITGRTSAIWSLMMLAIDRCIAIYKPVQYSSMITPFSTGSAIIFIWLSSGLIGSIPFWGSIS